MVLIDRQGFAVCPRAAYALEGAAYAMEGDPPAALACRRIEFRDVRFRRNIRGAGRVLTTSTDVYTVVDDGNRYRIGSRVPDVRGIHAALTG